MKAKTKLFLSLIALLFVAACQEKPVKIGGKTSFTPEETDGLTPADSLAIEHLLDSLNVAAANADFKKYFSYYTETATYNGTDATENWTKQTFMEWAKPYFDGKTTWNFKSVKRNLYFGTHNDVAWFEELLNTQMKICRGSGVVVKENGKWKIQQYVLSMTIPNGQLDKVVAIKTPAEDSLLQSYKP